MCGICGIVNLKGKTVKEESVHDMMRIMKHRGPDDEGVFMNEHVGFGFVRLSILDLSEAGHQPMVSRDNRFVIVFNGEIFNYIELRYELENKGYKFSTETDTEVLLNAYQEWGESCLHKLNGMWAFAIYNKETSVLFAARDRYGIKPFYYIWQNNRFLFASEIPPLLCQLNQKPTPDNHTIFEYLAFNRTDQTDSTFFNEVKKMQHGHCLHIQGNNVSISKWYDLDKRVKVAEPFKTADEFYDLFYDAIKLRLRSDVPVGVCLSGGLDSSSIVAMLQKKFEKKDLNTFSAVYQDGETGDEKEFIYEFKGDVKHMHFTTPSADSLLADLNSFIETHSEPIPSTGPYAQYKVMETANKHVVVTLDGQGADEILSGYHYFFGFFFKDLLKKGKFFLLLKEIIAYFKKHKSLYGIQTFLYFMLPSQLKTKVRINQRGYLNKEFVELNGKDSAIVENLYASESLQDALINHFKYKLEHLLKWEDRNSMHFSIEARVPFLDYRLVERMLSTSAEHIIKKGTTKAILRDAMKGIVPEKIRVRSDKVGFDTPQDKWFRRDDFKKGIQDIIDSKDFEERGIFDVKNVKSLYNKHLNEKIDIAKDIWKWINLELWFRKYID